MPRSLLFSTLLVHLVLSFASADENYPTTQERVTFLQVVATTVSEKPLLEIENLEARSKQEVEFLVYFKDQVFPHVFEMEQKGSLYSLYSVAIDRALYVDETEKQAWQKIKLEAIKRHQELATSDEWKAKIKSWGKLAQGLNGELPDKARRMFEEDELTGVSADLRPTLARLSEIDAEVSDISNTTKVTSKDLSEYSVARQEVERSFRAGDITILEAKNRLNTLWSKGFHAKGQEVIDSAGGLLDEAAILKTKVAQSKGFVNHAQYTLAEDKWTYAKGFASPDDKIQFLTQLLDGVSAGINQYLEGRAKRAGATSLSLLDASTLFLLVPESQNLVRDYFPQEGVDDFWKKTMLESGFSPRALEQINLDSFPRSNKQSHAYMSAAKTPKPKKLKVVKGSLNFERPSDSELWAPAQIYIVQNVISDGVSDYETVFHEGGHALDFVHRHEVLGNAEAYGYSETASMTMEHFFSDRDFILARGRDKQGRSPSEEIVDTYIKNKTLAELISVRGQALLALYDILIWNRPFLEGETSFIEHMEKTYDELWSRYYPVASYLPEGAKAFTSTASTGHFYSGSVRYSGYVFASIAATQTADYLIDELGRRTGRRTFLNQPGLAEILISGQYRDGFSKLFPSCTEQLTGQTYSPLTLIEKVNKAVAQATNF